MGFGAEGANGIALNSNNDIFVAGSFGGTVPFGNTILTSSGESDIYLAKFVQCDHPNANITYTGSLALCLGETKSLSTEYCSSNSYQWLRNNFNIPGATSPSYTANQAGSYTVLVSVFAGCDSISNPITLTVSTISVPVITQNGNLLLSTAASTYQWNLNGNPISGATNQFFQPQVSGVYSVLVTDGNGCSELSDTMSVVITGINSFNENLQLNIYPNPANDNITIEFTAQRKDAIISIYDIEGELLLQTVSQEIKSKIDISILAKGIYYVEVRTEKGITVKKFIKE